MTVGRRILGEVGVGADAEDTYRTLLANPGLTADELVDHVGFDRLRLRSALAELERLAMVTRLGGSPACFQPAPPDVVVESLVISREEALRRTRLEAGELLRLRRHPEQVDVTEIVEVLTDRDGYARRWTQVQTATRERLELFVKPPFTRPMTPDDEDLQVEMLGRGVVSRCLYDQDALAQPGILEHALRMAEVGEQARVVSELPTKLVLSDRRLALVPYIQDDPGRTVDAGLEVHQSALLDALIALFEVYWARGQDLRPSEDPEPDQDTKAGEDEVLALMASGLKDAAIARHLDVSAQTVRRRIRAVQQRLGVTTRFQAGLALGRDGRPTPTEQHGGATASRS